MNRFLLILACSLILASCSNAENEPHKELMMEDYDYQAPMSNSIFEKDIELKIHSLGAIKNDQIFGEITYLGSKDSVNLSYSTSYVQVILKDSKKKEYYLEVEPFDEMQLINGTPKSFKIDVPQDIASNIKKGKLYEISIQPNYIVDGYEYKTSTSIQIK